jgi:regulator of protease activity HflC (stomatin/prohibitin superfamily)
MKTEKTVNPISGYLLVLLELFLLLVVVGGAFINSPAVSITTVAIMIFLSVGFVIINPNQSAVLVLFGAYKGSIRENGFFWVNPFFVKKRVSLRARNFNSEPIKVNDKVGNPVMIGMVLVWNVDDTYKSSFAVDDFEHFVKVQSEAALRKLAGMFPYDNFETHDAVITLRASSDEVNHRLEEEIKERLMIAGITVIEARISYIAYASEIAGAMLRRQQATAIIAARSKIVEGAVGMVEDALDALSKKGIVTLDEERKAAMVSNLMVVLCSEESARPVINAGTLYS